MLVKTLTNQGSAIKKYGDLTVFLVCLNEFIYLLCLLKFCKS